MKTTPKSRASIVFDAVEGNEQEVQDNWVKPVFSNAYSLEIEAVELGSALACYFP